MRPFRDILAEAMRRERLGLMRPLWGDADEEFRETWRRRADFVIRVLHEIGDGKDAADAATGAVTSPEVYRHPLADGKSERLIRRDHNGKWAVIKSTGGTETTEVTFRIQDAWIAAGEVLTDDPNAKSIPGLGRMLAAAVEIHRVGAAEEGRDGR